MAIGMVIWQKACPLHGKRFPVGGRGRVGDLDNVLGVLVAPVDAGHLDLLGGTILLYEGLTLQPAQQTSLTSILVPTDDDFQVIVASLQF